MPRKLRRAVFVATATLLCGTLAAVGAAPGSLLRHSAELRVRAGRRSDSSQPARRCRGHRVAREQVLAATAGHGPTRPCERADPFRWNLLMVFRAVTWRRGASPMVRRHKPPGLMTGRPVAAGRQRFNSDHAHDHSEDDRRDKHFWRQAEAARFSRSTCRCRAATRSSAGAGPSGVRPDAAFVTASIACEPRDLIAIVTDGLTEAAKAEGHEISLDSLKATLLQSAGAPLGEVVAAFRTTSAKRGEKLDDRTVPLVRREMPPTTVSIAGTWEASSTSCSHPARELR